MDRSSPDFCFCTNTAPKPTDEAFADMHTVVAILNANTVLEVNIIFTSLKAIFCDSPQHNLFKHIKKGSCLVRNLRRKHAQLVDHTHEPLISDDGELSSLPVEWCKKSFLASHRLLELSV